MSETYLTAKRATQKAEEKLAVWGNLLRELGEAIINNPENVQMENSTEGVPQAVAAVAKRFDARRYPDAAQINRAIHDLVECRLRERRAYDALSTDARAALSPRTD